MTSAGGPTEEPTPAAGLPGDDQAGDGLGRTSRPRSRRRWIGRGLLAIGVLLVLSAGWVSWRTYQAYQHLNRAADQITALQGQVKNLDDIDVAVTSATVERLHAETDGAVSATADPLYRLAAHLPWLGADLRAMRTIAVTSNGLASTTAPSLVSVAQVAQPSSLTPKGGGINLGPITAAGPKLTSADQEVKAAQRSIAGIDQGALVAPLARAVAHLQQKLGALAQTTDEAALIGRLAPPMLGADVPRRYLVVFENLAEPRATGGLFGSFALLTIDAGRLSLTGQGSVARDIGKLDGAFRPALPVPAGLPAALYGDLPGAYSTDTNLTPDFPTAAGLLAKMYQLRHQVTVDGVLALDPVALGYMMKGATPIPVGHDLDLSSGNITAILLSKAYDLYPQLGDAPARDTFLAVATAKVFKAVTQAPSNASLVVKGVTKAAREHRVLLWSSHPAEEADLAGTAIGQLLPASDVATPTIGVFRNDGTGGKLGYYADGAAAVTAGACDSRGRRTISVTVRMDYTAPATGLPPYVLGFARGGPYVLRTNVLVFAPANSTIASVLVDGKPAPVVTAQELGRPVTMVTVDQKPGQQAQVVATLLVPAPSSVAATFTPAVVLTPGIKNWGASTVSYAAC